MILIFSGKGTKKCEGLCLIAFDISRCDFALLSSATFLSPEIAHHSIMLVLLSACIHSLETKIKSSNDSSEITDSGGTGRFSTKHVETTEFCSWECIGQETMGKILLGLWEVFLYCPQRSQRHTNSKGKNLHMRESTDTADLPKWCYGNKKQTEV